MKDYSFGNFLCALRVGRGLSQYQLGALVGVTDKAVSKWENGDAKPRLQTCYRLAAVLGVSANELLSCEYQNDHSTGKGVFPMQEKLIERAYEQLHTIYGEQPPLECWSRLETELTILKDSEALLSFGFLSELVKTAKNKNGSITVRGTATSSFTAWLLGATGVDPLPAHYYCPKCRKVIFQRGAEDGFDLPEKMCDCGTALRRDGHSIPFDSYASTISKGNSIEVNISVGMEQFAVDVLRNYYKDIARILPIVVEEPMAPAEYQQMIRYVVLPDGVSMPILDEDGFLHMTNSAHHEKYRGFTSYLFFVSPVDSRIEAFMQKHRRPLDEEYFAPNVIRQVYQNRCEALPHITAAVKECDTVNFSLLSRIDGISCSTDVWQDNGEELIRSEIAGIRELVAFREDIWKMIVDRASPKALSGTGLPTKIMDNVRLGRYQRDGMPNEVERLLRQLDVPEWYIGHIAKICYVFPKSHCISYLIRDLKLAWCRERWQEEVN